MKQLFSELYPDIAAQWHPQLNPYSPDQIINSASKAWWICSKGHVFEEKILTRLAEKDCPYCSGKKKLEDKQSQSSLAESCPSIAKQWHPSKNGSLMPSEVSIDSTQCVWWLCPNGHEYEAVVRSRTKTKKMFCPYCTGILIIHGENDFATKFPELAKEWHPSKNMPFIPSEISSKNNHLFWWICSNGHEYESSIKNRILGHGCPVCKQMQKTKCSLQMLFPDIAAQWHPTLNGDLTPEDVSKSSSKKVWWICPESHVYQSEIRNRTGLFRTGCPYCAGRKALKGFNDLKTLYPELASEWNQEKNGDASPDEITPGSSHVVWWKCKEGHDWQCSVEKRTRTKSGCPVCRTLRIKQCLISPQKEKEKQSLQDIYPDCTEEWDFEKNGTLSPYDVSKSSKKIVWWKCAKGHSYQTSVGNKIHSRNTKTKSCPYCASKKVLSGYNDLQTLFPEKVSDWHFARNGDLHPCDVLPKSNLTVWWICPYGHEYQQTIISHTHNKHNCPVCRINRRFTEK